MSCHEVVQWSKASAGIPAGSRPHEILYSGFLTILKHSVQHFPKITTSTSPKILSIIVVHNYSVHPVNACMLCTVLNASITKSIKVMDFHKYTMLNALQSQIG